MNAKIIVNPTTSEVESAITEISRRSAVFEYLASLRGAKNFKTSIALYPEGAAVIFESVSQLEEVKAEAGE